MNADQRRFIREHAVIDGAFRCLDSDAHGTLIMTDRSAGGIRATLTHPLEPGKRVECGIHLPEQALPVFTRGTVMWVRAKSREHTFGFDAGIRWDTPGRLDTGYAPGLRVSPWRIQRIAAFASQRGYFARRFPETHGKSRYFLPSLWLAYLIIGSGSALLFPRWAPFFVASLGIWLAIELFQSLRLAAKHRTRGSTVSFFAMASAVWLNKPLIYLEYAIFFLRGFVSRHAPHEAP